MCVKDRLSNALQRVSDAASKAGRKPKDLLVVAVAKKQPVELIEEAVACGQLDIGENYFQEAEKKMNELAQPSIRWHMIGPIQSKKVKKMSGKFYLIHSVDRLSVAEKLSEASQELETRQRVLMQVNISGEESKSGFSPDELERAMELSDNWGGLQIEGLMAMPPYSRDPEASRPYFTRLRQLAEKVKPHVPAPHLFHHLSMGTTQDFEVAIEEGATIVRLGTLIFGERTSL